MFYEVMLVNTESSLLCVLVLYRDYRQYQAMDSHSVIT